MIERFRLQKSCWLVKVINTATGGEALILSMYTNYFDGPVCIGESVLHFEKTLKFHGCNFPKLKTQPMLSYVAGYFIIVKFSNKIFRVLITQLINPR